MVVPQSYELPYHPIDHKKKLEQIYRSSSPTLEQKLDMMASLIEDGDESYFHVEPVDSSIGVADRIETVGVNSKLRLAVIHIIRSDMSCVVF